MSFIIETWMNYGPSVWFNSSRENDKLIITQLAHFLPTIEVLNQIQSFDRTILLENIILTDQVARHVYRGNDHVIFEYGKKSIDFVEIFLKLFEPNNCFELLHCGLPLRHFPTDERIQIVMNMYDDYEAKYPKDAGYIGKLRETTNKRYRNWIRKNRVLKTDENGNILDTDILDPLCENNKILNTNKLFASPQYQICKSHIIANSKSQYLLSLSGGVDSMILALIFLGLKEQSILHFEAFHFNYMVRKESVAEELYLRNFCLQNNIKLHVVRIDQSDPNLVDNWDSATKIQRYRNYKKTIQTMKRNDSEEIPVVLGHHQDDVYEGIIMNLFNNGTCNGGRYLWHDLSGMPSNSKVQDVHIYRPLVDMRLTKNWVLKLSEDFSVPYFRDTSFDLATRIRVRREVLPLLQDVFGTSLETQLLSINQQSKDLETLLDSSVSFSYDKERNTITLDLQKILSSKYPDKIIVSAILDAIKTKMFELKYNIPSQKSILNMIHVIRRTLKLKVTFNLRASYHAVYFTNLNHLVIYLI